MLNCIFDFNGTMIFDENIQKQSWLTFLTNNIKREVTEEEFQKYVHGRNVVETLEYFFQKKFSLNEALAMGEEKEKIYRKMCLESDEFRLAPGLVDFLDFLKESQIPRTIATASAYQNTKFFFEQLHLDDWFDFSKVVYDDGKIKGKPEPNLFLEAANRLGVAIEDCVIFEDSMSGIEAAKRSNCKKIVMINSMNKNMDVEKSLILKDFSDISCLIEFIK